VRIVRFVYRLLYGHSKCFNTATNKKNKHTHTHEYSHALKAMCSKLMDVCGYACVYAHLCMYMHAYIHSKECAAS
jgi:hypothetical protein